MITAAASATLAFGNRVASARPSSALETSGHEPSASRAATSTRSAASRSAATAWSDDEHPPAHEGGADEHERHEREQVGAERP